MNVKDTIKNIFAKVSDTNAKTKNHQPYKFTKMSALEQIMSEALEDNEDSVSIARWLITNLNFADDIVVNAEEEEEDYILVNCLDTTTKT